MNAYVSRNNSQAQMHNVWGRVDSIENEHKEARNLCMPKVRKTAKKSIATKAWWLIIGSAWVVINAVLPYVTALFLAACVYGWACGY